MTFGEGAFQMDQWVAVFANLARCGHHLRVAGNISGRVMVGDPEYNTFNFGPETWFVAYDHEVRLGNKYKYSTLLHRFSRLLQKPL